MTIEEAREAAGLPHPNDCECQDDSIETPGPHKPTCPWSDPDYEPFGDRMAPRDEKANEAAETPERRALRKLVSLWDEFAEEVDVDFGTHLVEHIDPWRALVDKHPDEQGPSDASAPSSGVDEGRVYRRAMGINHADDDVAEAQRTSEARPVCDRCNDTHTVKGEERTSLCTACPTPCDRCKAGAYCATTPCSCSCHRASDPLLESVKNSVGDSRTNQREEIAALREALNITIARLTLREQDDGIMTRVRVLIDRANRFANVPQ